MVRLGLAVAGPPIISRSSHVLPVIVPWEKLVVRRDTSAWRDVRQAEGNRMNYDELVRQRKDCRLCVGGGPSRLRNGSPLVYAPEIVSRFSRWRPTAPEASRRGPRPLGRRLLRAEPWQGQPVQFNGSPAARPPH